MKDADGLEWLTLHSVPLQKRKKTHRNEKERRKKKVFLASCVFQDAFWEGKKKPKHITSTSQRGGFEKERGCKGEFKKGVVAVLGCDVFEQLFAFACDV